jgi:hypothetical protein
MVTKWKNLQGIRTTLKNITRPYLVDKPDPELRPILHFIRHQHRTFRSTRFMDQISIVLYRNRKGWTAQVIDDDLVATLCVKAITYSTVTNYLRAARIIRRDAIPLSVLASPHIDDSDKAILKALDEFLFSLVQRLVHTTHLPVNTVCRRLSAKLGFTVRHLRRVPHIRSDDQKGAQIQCSRSLLTILRI